MHIFVVKQCCAYANKYVTFVLIIEWLFRAIQNVIFHGQRKERA